MTKLYNLLLMAILASLAFIAHGKTTSGSGFFITQDGYFVTSHHVISNASKIILNDTSGKKHEAVVVKADKFNDIAILKAEGSFSHLPIANSRGSKRGLPIITIGYPHIDAQGTEPKLTEGLINSLSGAMDDPRVFQISAPVQSGNSGGPLVTREGNVIGVIVSKLSASTIFKETGDIPQNVNYAIKSNYLNELLANIPDLEQKLKTPNIKSFGTTVELSEFVEKATAYVIASDSVTADHKDNAGKPLQKPSSEKKGAHEIKAIIDAVKEGRHATENIVIQAPSTAGNGEVVPFEIATTAPLKNNEKLYLIINEEYISHVVTPHGDTKVLKFGGRVRMPRSGNLLAIIVDDSNRIRASSKEVKVGIGSSMNEQSRALQFDYKSRTSRKTPGEAEIRFLINSSMSKAEYIESVKIVYEDSGSLVIEMTQAASKNPYLEIITVDGNYKNLILEFNLNDGTKVIRSQSF